MNKVLENLLSFLGLIVLAAILFFGYKNTNPKITVAPIISETATTTFTHIELSYPKSSSSELPEIYNLIQQTKRDFLSEYGTLTLSEAQAKFLRRDSPYELYITTKIATSTQTVSYIIEIYEYTGGAHGGTDVQSFTYNKFGKLITITDVLGYNYLPQISKMAREYFYKNLGDYALPVMIDSGTEPKLDNFNTWYLTPKSVTFIFGQYQVGPYVLGIQEYPIEKSSITQILNPLYK